MGQADQAGQPIRSLSGYGVRMHVCRDGRRVQIPEHLADVRIAKSGYPDKRDANYSAYMAWVESIEADGDQLDSPAQSLALRIWSGQSIDVPIGERVARIRAGLAEQGFDTTGITLPHPDAGRYL